MDSYHTPVLLHEIIDALHVGSGKRYIDATLGGAGHTLELVRRGAVVLGIDTDSDAINYAQGKLEKETVSHHEAGSWVLQQGNFRELKEIAKQKGFEMVDGMLFDLGVSSFQLDTADRGFSYRFRSAPLDLRLDRNAGQSASEFIAHASEEELYEIIATYGEEEHARSIAHAIISARQIKPIYTVEDLVVSFESKIKGEKEPTFSRVFQALRIYINDEMSALRSGLQAAESLLKKDGTIAIISFHSLEDRIVKLFLQRPEWKVLSKKPIRPTEKELFENRRSRSAKLRIAQRV